MYNRKKSEDMLIAEYGYKTTGEKHCENIWTWWYQNFWLFERYGIDKRKAHLSSLIVSGQMTRQEALDELGKNPVYPELGLEKRALKYPKKSYNDYPNSGWTRKLVVKLYKFIPTQWKS